MHMFERMLLFFVKYPRPGQVKTRLAHHVGADAACALYRCCVADMLQSCAAASAPTTIVYDPAAPRDLYAGWLGERCPLTPQSGGDLGQRMQNSLCEAFAAGADQAVLIGSDIPDLQVGTLDGAFACLERSACVLGPAGDGGYYLIGFRRDGFCPEVFDACDWGAPTVCAATVRTLEGARRSFALLQAYDDLDTADDLKRYLVRNAHGRFRRSRTYDYAERSGIAGRLLA
jgi:uncharacterized protein